MHPGAGVHLADGENFGYFGVRVILHGAQDEGLALWLSQGGNGALDGGSIRLGVDDALFGSWIDLTYAGQARMQSNLETSPALGVGGHVAQNSVQPRGESIFACERRESAVGTQQRFLHDVLGVVLGAHEPPGTSNQDVVVRLDNSVEGIGFTVLERDNECLIGRPLQRTRIDCQWIPVNPSLPRLNVSRRDMTAVEAPIGPSGEA